VRYEFSKIGFVSSFFLFFSSSRYESYHKVETDYPIALKFSTQKGGIRGHFGNKFGWNAINTRQVICDYSRNIIPIFCHAHRVNRTWQEAENWYRGRLTIKPQTFCNLKEIELKDHKGTAKKPTVCNDYENRELLIKCHSSQTNSSAESTKNWCVDALHRVLQWLEESSFNPVSYSATTNHVQ